MNHSVLVFEPLFDELLRRGYIVRDRKRRRYLFVGNSLDVRRGGASSTRLWEIADPTGLIVRRAAAIAAVPDHHTGSTIAHSSEPTDQTSIAHESIEPF